VQATTALNMMKRPNSKKISVVRRRNEWDLFEPVVEILSEKEVEALYMREERNARLKKRQEEKDDAFMSRYVRV
jgi:SWI/SNF-related matrix-associated actin-dependent regulator of chromatin subfamily B protein 1